MAKLQRAWHTTVIATYQLYQLHKYAVHTYVHYMLNKNTLGVKKVRGQSEATMVI